jgi:hypothetical protein
MSANHVNSEEPEVTGVAPVEVTSRRDPAQFGGAEHDFSLVTGGPLFQMYRRTHLVIDPLELLRRRIVVITAIAWLPLLFLSLLDLFSGRAVEVSFLRDVEVHARFLVALPVLIFAEVIVHSRLKPAVRRFVERRIVVPEDLQRFDRMIDSAVRLRNSNVLEIGLLVIVYTAGLWLWGSRIPINSATWYAMPGGRWHLTPAGYWYVFVSIPIVQFVLLRWYLKLFIWFRFLWQVSRLKLHLVPTHPDRCAGLGFLGGGSYAFGPLLFAQGAMLAGVVASRVLYQGQKLMSFKMQIGGFVVFFVFAILCPLLMFTPQMLAAKRRGLAEFGQIAQDYVDEFETRWVNHNSPEPDELLGSGDIQSLADLDGSFSVVNEMRWVPVKLNDAVRLAAATAAPFVPLLFTVFSLEELVTRLVKMLF